MVLVDRFLYVANIMSIEGEPIAQLPLVTNFFPAAQWAYLQALRQGLVPPIMLAQSATVRPLWHTELGEPRIAGIRVTVHADVGESGTRLCGGAGVGPHFNIPRGYLRSPVEHAASQLVEAGMLASGQRFLFDVCAYPKPASEPANTADQDRFTVETILQPLRLGSASLADRLRHAVPRPGSDHVDDMPVFIPQRVVSEAKELAHQAGDVESGAALIGRLYRDTESLEVFAEITALISAHTRAGPTHLTFTSESWAAVNAAIALRGANELCLGFFHSHPFWCASCPKAHRRICPLIRKPFFSRADVALLHEVFPAAFNIAVLVSDLGEDDLRLDVFGYRFGLVMPRGYFLTGQIPEKDDAVTVVARSEARVDHPASTCDTFPRAAAVVAGSAADPCPHGQHTAS